MKLEGWKLTGLLSLGLVLMAVFILAAYGWTEEGVRVWVRASARTSVALFLLAFVSSSLHALARSGVTAWLLRNRRYIGVSFAISHYLHLGSLISLAIAFPSPFFDELELTTVIGGGLAYLFITAMTITSFDRTTAWLGRRRWKILHTLGSYYIFVIFAQTDGFRDLNEHFQSSIPGLFITSMPAAKDFGLFFAFTVSVKASAQIIGKFLLSNSTLSST